VFFLHIKYFSIPIKTIPDELPTVILQEISPFFVVFGAGIGFNFYK